MTRNPKQGTPQPSALLRAGRFYFSAAFYIRLQARSLLSVDVRPVATVIMSIFSKLSQAKKAAKNHKEAQAQQKAPELEDRPVPYKHVVTHAAIDALSGAPSSWREADRAAIKATNEKRKSMVTRNSSNLSSTLPRNSSYGTSSNYSYSRPMPSRVVENRRSYGANGGYYTNASGLTVGNPTFQPSPLASKGTQHGQSQLAKRSSNYLDRCLSYWIIE